jgi:hypothetical protein
MEVPQVRQVLPSALAQARFLELLAEGRFPSEHIPQFSPAQYLLL